MTSNTVEILGFSQVIFAEDSKIYLSIALVIV